MVLKWTGLRTKYTERENITLITTRMVRVINQMFEYSRKPYENSDYTIMIMIFSCITSAQSLTVVLSSR